MNTKPASMSFSVFFVHAVFQWVCWGVGVKGFGWGVGVHICIRARAVMCGGYPKITWEAGEGSIFLIIMRVQMVGNAYGIFKNKIQK